MQPTRYITSVESLGRGVTRLHTAGYGYADVSALYSAATPGWTVQIEQTNIQDPDVQHAVLAEFRRMEGLEA